MISQHTISSLRIKGLDRFLTPLIWKMTPRPQLKCYINKSVKEKSEKLNVYSLISFVGNMVFYGDLSKNLDQVE